MFTEDVAIEVPAYPFQRATGDCPFAPPSRYEQLRETRPVTRVQLWDGSTPFLLTGYEVCQIALTDPRFSSDGTNRNQPRFVKFDIPDDVFNFGKMDDPGHARLRRMVAGHFASRPTEAMRPAIQEVCDAQLGQLVAAGAPADLVLNYAFPIPSLVIGGMLGVAGAGLDEFARNSVQALDPSLPAEKMGEVIGEMVDFVGELCDRKRIEPGDDLISHLVLNFERTSELATKQLVATVMVVLLAGYETTANMIALGTTALLREPEQLAALRAEPAGFVNAVEELLRWHTIVQDGTGRVALEDLDLGGVRIPAGSGVILNLPAANRDPEVFPEPARLDVTRFNARRHFAFGYGVHQCVGMTLARIELHTALQTLLCGLPGLALATPFEELDFALESMNLGLGSLPVTW
ncbi:cytochrome P450 [Amycolatopsis sp. NPDC051061]|uniref:cytochrome P450 n=1 Tax=Amycolatopsis sp. NPDC051061 TaxID=3155042 RepID=UPI0034171D89